MAYRRLSLNNCQRCYVQGQIEVEMGSIAQVRSMITFREYTWYTSELACYNFKHGVGTSSADP